MTLHQLINKANQLSAIISSAQYTSSAYAPLDDDSAISRICSLLTDCHQRGGHIYLIGNGGSASIASHVANDFCNTSSLRAITIHDHSLLTCFANDYGYEQAYGRILQKVAQPQDLLITISSSGKSANMLYAADCMQGLGAKTLTLTGFNKQNPLRACGELNIWLDSTDYGQVELGHLFILHHISSLLTENKGNTDVSQ